MSAANQFVCELIRAANGIGRMDSAGKQQLLNRAAAAIHDMREKAGPVKKSRRDALLELQNLIVAAYFGRAPDADISAGFLKAATLIRDLHIVLDARAVPQVAAS